MTRMTKRRLNRRRRRSKNLRESTSWDVEVVEFLNGLQNLAANTSRQAPYQYTPYTKGEKRSSMGIPISDAMVPGEIGPLLIGELDMAYCQPTFGVSLSLRICPRVPSALNMVV